MQIMLILCWDHSNWKINRTLQSCPVTTKLIDLTMYVSQWLMANYDLTTILIGQGKCFTDISWALQNNLAKIYNARNPIYGENFKLSLCTCAQNMVLGTCSKFQLNILIRSTISATHKFGENILKTSLNVSETPLRLGPPAHWEAGLTKFLSSTPQEEPSCTMSNGIDF